jgi:tryptophan synthase alpha chain
MPIQNRLTKIFSNDPKNLLSVYFVAGYPNLDSVITTAKELQAAGVDFIEIGFPYSDPLADGPVIQKSSAIALKNGMNLNVLFEDLKRIRDCVQIPILLMGYINPVLQYGMEAFCKSCFETGIDGIIIPDLPILEYETLYQELFEKYNLSNIFLVTPQSAVDRILKIDGLTKGFIYLLSSSSTTGQTVDLQNSTSQYLKRIKSLNLNNPLMVGFGISNSKAFKEVCIETSGAIVGTAFIRAQNEGKVIAEFVKEIRG